MAIQPKIAIFASATVVSATAVADKCLGMEFFGRQEEIERLKAIEYRSKTTAQFTIVTGRRRIGKTSLVLKAYENMPMLYFFVARISEAELCDGYKNEIEAKLDMSLPGRITRFADIFEYLMKQSVDRPITLMIDEFQDFFRVNASIFSEMQRIWDLYKDKAKMNLLVCGSVNSLMNKIFRDRKEPLFGRQTQQLTVERFPTILLKEIIRKYNPEYSQEDLLALYTITGGVARYVELLLDSGAITKQLMLEAITEPQSLFIGEGKAMLVEEFGRDYGIYFTILTAIATGNNSRAEIEEKVGKQIGGYLSKLEDDYGLIKKAVPLFAKTTGKTLRYAMDDCFLTLWFRFFFKYSYLLEIRAYNKLREIIERDYEVFSGFALERYFRDKLIEEGNSTRLGGWWQRTGDNEIDLISADEINKTVTFYEIKRNSDKISIPVLQEKAKEFLKVTKKFRGFDMSYKKLSMDDI